MKILTIVGARPQFIKAATVSRAISQFDNVEEIIVHTGQHFDANMSEVFFQEMKIPEPKYNLGIKESLHGAMTGKMLMGIEELIIKEQPDYVLVYGDTNSTLAGALAAKKLHFKLAHVEAGLRSFNLEMPEEINRILTDRISDFLFCPTDTAINNLNNEGFQNIDCKVVNCGDVMFDATLFYLELAKKPQIDLSGEYILATIHRAENTDDKQKLVSIIESFKELSLSTQVIIPLHPRTRNKLKEYNIDYSGIKFIEPLGYLEMIWLLQNCKLVMTDSGGLQKEAFFHKKSCITLRDETEWVELVDNGYNIIAGSDKASIKEAYSKIISSTVSFDKELYGTGNAGKIIIEKLLKNHKA